MTRSTPGQQDAIRIQGRPVIVEAGAGTGKTWTLVERFLHLVETNPAWPLESIAAVTFTEKAAREMRTRLRAAIAEKARQAGPESPWQAHRRGLERLQVGTIHGLCARILRENAIAAGIDPLFSVLDERQAEALQEEAVRQCFIELVEADDPALELLSALRVRDLGEQIILLLSQRGSVERLFEGLPDPVALVERWRAGLAETRRHVWRSLLETEPLLRGAEQDLRGYLIQDETDKLTAAVAAAKAGCPFFADQERTEAVKCWLSINLMGGRPGAWGGADALAALKGTLKALRGAAQALEKAGCLAEVGALDEQSALALQRWRALWRRTEAVYARMKSERQALDFDDLELLTARLLAREPRDARLAETVRGLNHLMVDEFQDTNEIQQRIVYALASPQEGGRLFVVGDAKQSIYRFRQAQVTVFNRTASDILQAGGAAVRLERSFRAHECLVRALNHLFASVLRTSSGEFEDFEARPGALEAERPSPPAHPAAPAAVELCLLPEKTADGSPVSAEEARIFEAQLLARRILDLHAAGLPVWDKERKTYRPFRFSDAVILFRATTSLPLYEEQFKAACLPYLTVSGRGYFDRPEVRDLIALLAGLHNPSDDLNLAVCLRSPLFGLSDETLYRLRWHGADGQRMEPAVPYSAALANPPPTDQPVEVDFARAALGDLLGLAGRVNPYRLLRRALDLTGYEAALASTEQDGRQHSNVRKLLDMARDQAGANLSAFLRGLQDLTAREAREGESLGAPPESGAVTLMSIHAAKGLEFPVVVVADLGRKPGRGGADPLILHDPAIGLVCKQRDEKGDWQEPAGYTWGKWLLGRMEAAENKRLLYVACTRAADLLILSGKSGEAGWMGDILGGWGIQAAGAEEETLQFEDFGLAVRRPAYHPGPRSAAAERGSAAPALTEMPALTQPLQPFPTERHIAVTRLRKILAEEADGPALPRLAVRSAQPESGKVRAPAYLIGRFVHRFLADWDAVALPAVEMDKRLIALARGEGILHPEAVRHAVNRAREMLEQLERSGLFGEIQAAAQRHSEVPFTLSTPQGQLHGVIDLLFRDQAGGWHLVEWKTESIMEAELEEQAAAHRAQVAVYAAAARKILRGEPSVRVCFLAARAAVRSYSPAELAAEISWLVASGAGEGPDPM